MWTEKTEEKEVTDDEDEESEEDDGEDGPKVEESSEAKEKKTKKIKEVSHEWEKLNKTKPLWMREKDSITEEEYTAFYKSLTNDWEEHPGVSSTSAGRASSSSAILFVRSVHHSTCRGRHGQG